MSGSDLLDLLCIPYIQVTADGTIVFASDSFLTLAHLSPKSNAFKPLKLSELASEQHYPEIQLAITRGYNEVGSLVSFTLTIANTDPELERRLLFTGKSNVTAKQEKQLFLKVEDMTAFESLEFNHNKLLEIMGSAGEISQLGHWQIDVKTERVFWSDEIYEIHGVTKQEYLPDLESTIDFYHPHDIDKVKKLVHQAIKSGEGWMYQLRIIRPSGELRYVISNGSIHKNEAGEPEYIYGVLQDITDHKKLENERNLLDVAVKNTDAGIVMTDAERKVIWCNMGFELLTGYTLEEVKGKTLTTFLQGPETDQATINYLKETLTCGDSVNLKNLNYHKNGQTYWNQLIITPIYRDKQLTHFVGIQHNVTEEVEAKRQLKELNETLESKVAERTLALETANRELVKLSTKDPLTGALNRRAFYTDMDREMKRAERNKQPLAISMIDIDYFKQVNDKHGHQAGDKVIKEMVDNILQHMRTTDSLYRMGGEEFLLLMTNTGKIQASIVCERIRKYIEESEVILTDTSVKYTVSMGLAAYKGKLSTAELLYEADELLYESKQNGRNQISISKN